MLRGEGFWGKISRKNGGKPQGYAPKISFNAAVIVFIALTFISVLMLIFSSGSFFLNVKNLGLSLFTGVRGGIYKLSSTVSGTILSVGKLAELRKDYTELLKQLENYEELQRSNAEIYQENIRLREQLGFAREINFKRIPAEISGRDPDNLFSALVINKGSFAGVTNDMTVVAWQNGVQALVGKVIQTGAFESLVMPVFDNNSLASARLLASRFEGIVEGQGNRDTPLLMRFVPKRAREEINIGDIVASSGIGGVFPAGINIGRVSRIYDVEYETTLEIELVPMIDFSRLEYVFLIENEEAAGLSND